MAKTPREMLSSATHQNWAQQGMSLIVNTGSIRLNDQIIEALADRGIEAEHVGAHSVKVSIASLRDFTADDATAIRNSMNGDQSRGGEVIRLPQARTR